MGSRLSLKTDHAHSTVSVAWIINTGDDLGHQGVGLRFVQGVLTASGAIAIGYAAKDKGLQTVGWIGAKWIKRGTVAGVAEVVRELDDFRHTAEVLTQHNVLSESNLRIAVEAALS